MRLYEVDQALLDCVDEETGEIIDSERFEALLKEKSEKLEQCALWIKDMQADEKKLAEEIKRLQDRKSALEHKRESVKQYIAYVLNGQKYKTEKVSIYFKESKSVNILDESKIPDEYCKITRVPSKTEIDKALMSGRLVEGAELQFKQSLIIR